MPGSRTTRCAKLIRVVWYARPTYATNLLAPPTQNVVEDKNCISRGQRNVKTRVQLLSFSTQLSLPLRLRIDRLAATQPQRLLPYLRWDPVQGVAKSHCCAFYPAHVLEQDCGCAAGDVLPSELRDLLDPEFSVRRLVGSQDTNQCRKCVWHRLQPDGSTAVTDSKATRNAGIDRYERFHERSLAR
jgi:Zn-finger protein